MGTNHINVTDSSEPGEIPVRRRNNQGPVTKAISVTLPIELNSKLDSMAGRGEKSFLITELLVEALAAREQKG